MQHHETPADVPPAYSAAATSKALRLTLRMIAALFGADLTPASATRRALIARGLFVVEGDRITITDAGSAARDAIETEALNASRTTPVITVEMPSGDPLEIPPGEITPDEDDSAVTGSADAGPSADVPAPSALTAEEVTAGTTLHADGVEVTITEDAHRFRDYGGVDVVALNGVTAGGALFEGKALPGARLVRAREITPGMTIGLVSHDEPLREAIVTDVQIGDQVTIRAGSSTVATGPLTLFRLLNDGSLFENALAS